MRGKVKSARRKASKLHGASAQFVSLVDAGANETPFTLTKRKDGASAMTIKKRGKGKAAERKSHKTVKTPARKDDKPDEIQAENLIAKMVLSGEHYEDEAAVETYLEEAEWDAEATSIVKNDDGDWEVRPEGTSDDDFLKIMEVDTETEGVQAFVGQRELKIDDEVDTEDTDDEEDDEAETVNTVDEDEDEEDDEEVTDVQKSIEQSPKKLSKRAAFLKKRADDRKTERKFNSWDAFYSGAGALSKALKAGMKWDAVPPGFYEVQAAFNGVVATIVGGDDEGKQEAINKAAAEYAEIIGGLDTFFDQYVEADEETVAKSYEGEERVALVKWAENFADFASGETTQSTTEAQSVKKAAETSDGADGVADTVRDIIAKAVEPLTDRIDEVSGTVEALASRHPTKKAADVDDSGSTQPRKLSKQEEASEAAAARFGKSFLG